MSKVSKVSKAGEAPKPIGKTLEEEIGMRFCERRLRYSANKEIQAVFGEDGEVDASAVCALTTRFTSGKYKAEKIKMELFCTTDKRLHGSFVFAKTLSCDASAAIPKSPDDLCIGFTIAAKFVKQTNGSWSVICVCKYSLADGTFVYKHFFPYNRKDEKSYDIKTLPLPGRLEREFGKGFDYYIGMFISFGRIFFYLMDDGVYPYITDLACEKDPRYTLPDMVKDENGNAVPFSIDEAIMLSLY